MPTADHLAHAVTALERRDALLGIGHALVAIGQTLRDAPAEPAIGEQVTDSDGDVWQRFEDGWHWWVGGTDWSGRPRTRDYVQDKHGPLRRATDGDRRRVGLPITVTEEPAVGEQVTDDEGDVWQRFEDGWHWWDRGNWRWRFTLGTRDVQATFGPLRVTTDDDRRRVGLPVRDENTPPASTSSDTPRPGGRIEATVDGHRGVLVWADHPGCIVPGWVWEDRPDRCVADRDVHAHRVLPPQAPATAPESDAQPEGVPVDPETENGPENGTQGRIGWLWLGPGSKRRLLMREVPSGWTDADEDGGLLWLAKDWPDAEFTPIRTLADDEVVVKRGVLDNAAARLRGVVTVMDPSDVAIAHEAADTLTQAKIISDALEAGR